VTDILRLSTNARSSRIVVHNGVVYLSGQTADDRSQGVGGQTEQVLAKIDGLLAEAGVDRSRLLTAQVFLKDVVRDFKEMNLAWEAWTPLGNAPTRATVQAELANAQILVEIVVTAAVRID